MKQKIIAILAVLALVLSLAACGGGEETTITGMVVSVDGNVLTLTEMDTANMGSGNNGERPSRSDGSGNFQGFGNFDPENFDGTMPTGEGAPQWGSGERPERPEGMTMPEGMTPPEGMTIPEGMTPPEGMTMPEDGQMPQFDRGDGSGFDFGGMASDAETKTVDISNAHISIEIDGGKASGSISDITAGSFVTVTCNSKGEATYVLITSSGFGGFGGGFGGFGNFRGFGKQDSEA